MRFIRVSLSPREADALDTILETPIESGDFAPGVPTAAEFFGRMAMLWFFSESRNDKAMHKALVSEWSEHCRETGEDSREVSLEFVKAFKERWLQRAASNGQVEVGRGKGGGSKDRSPAALLPGVPAEPKPKRPKRTARSRA